MKLIEDIIIKDCKNKSKNKRILDIIIGLHYTLVHIESDILGISATVKSNAKLDIKNLINKKITTYEALEFIKSPISLKNSIGFATCQAILNYDYILNNKIKQGDVSEFLDINKNTSILFIGFIKPLINKLTKITDKIFIIERNTVRWQNKNLKIYDDTSIFNIIDKIDLIIASGQIFTNHTINTILQLKNIYKNKLVIVGPSTIISKKLKEELNINMLSGIYIKKEKINEAKTIIKLAGGTRDINSVSIKINL